MNQLKSGNLYETTPNDIIKHSAGITQNLTYNTAAAPPIARLNTPPPQDR